MDEHDEALWQLLWELASTNDVATMRALVTGRAELLGPRAGEMLDALVDNAPGPADATIWQQRRDLLRRCREVGPEAAFAELAALVEQTTGGRVAGRIPEAMRSAFRHAVADAERYCLSRDRADLDLATERWSTLVDDPRMADVPPDVGRLVRLSAGKCHVWRFAETVQEYDHARATELLGGVADGPPTDPLHADATYHLGRLAFDAARLLGRDDLLPDAAALCIEAIGDNEDSPELDAVARLTLAKVLQRQHARDHDPALLRQADGALSVACPAPTAQDRAEVTACHQQVLYALYTEHGDQDARDRAIAVAEAAIAADPDGPETSSAHRKLAFLLLGRSVDLNHTADTTGALAAARRALATGREPEDTVAAAEVLLAVVGSTSAEGGAADREVLDEIVAALDGSTAEERGLLLWALALRAATADRRAAARRADLDAAHAVLLGLEADGALTLAVPGVLAYATALTGSGRDDLLEAIDAVRRAAAAAPPSSADAGSAVAFLADLLLAQFEGDGTRAALDEAVQLRAADPVGSRRAAVFRARCLVAEAGATGSVAGLDRAAELLADLPEGDERDRSAVAEQRGRIELQRFRLGCDAAALDRAVADLRAAVAATPDGEAAALGRRLTLLGSAHLRRFETHGDEADFAAALAADRDALARGRVNAPSTDGRLAALLDGLPERLPADPAARYALLGDYHWLRHQGLSGGVDLEADLDATLRAREQAGGDDLDVDGLSAAINGPQEWATNARSVAAMRRVVAMRSRLDAVAGASHPSVRAELGLTLMDEHLLGGDRAAEAAVILEEVRATAPPGTAAHQSAVVALGQALLSQFERDGDPATLDRAIRRSGGAVAAPGWGDPMRAMLRMVHANALKRRYDASGDPADIATALELGEQAVAASADDDPERVGYLANLATFHQARFERTGDVADLDDAIRVGRQALTLPDRPESADANLNGNLMGALEARFEVTGDAESLDEAIEAGRASAAAAQTDAVNRGTFLSGLSIALRERYKLRGDPDDLAESVAAARRSVAIPGVHLVVSRLMLSLALRAEFRHTGGEAALDEAIAVADEVVRGPMPPTVVAGAHSNLGSLLMSRYEHRDALADLDRAIEMQRAVVLDHPTGGPQVATLLFNLAHAVQMRAADRRSSPEEADALRAEAERLLRRVADDAAAVTSMRVRAAVGRANLAVPEERWGDAVDGFALAVDLLPRLAVRAIPLDARAKLLRETSGLAGDAAAAALNAGQPALAVELLEAGRGVLLAQQLDLRGDLTELQRHLPEAAAELQQLSVDLEPVAGEDAGRGAAADRRHRASRRWDEVLATVREHPGFEDFLGVPRFAALAEAASDAPVVIVNVSRLRCDALILRPGGTLSVVPLPGLDAGAVARNVTAVYRRVAALRQAGGEVANRELAVVLRWMWTGIAEPVLTALGHREPVTDGRWPHVQWLPTGLLALLPLHAAGPEPGDAVLDRVVSSYTTTLRALVRARRRRTPPDQMADALVVAAEDRPGTAGNLPSADREGRIAHRALHATRPVLRTGPTARAEVLAALPDIGWAHFACHASTVMGRPGDGALAVGDPPLAVADVSRLGVDAHLAYLSACSTAQGDAEIADEAIHLASAFQMAGFTHVVGTLWAVGDAVALRFAEHVYGVLSDDPHQVATAVHHAVRAVRPGRSPLSWAAHVHFGPAAATRTPAAALSPR